MTSTADKFHNDAVVEVTGGVDTHKDTHTAAAIDAAGRVLGSAQFPTNPAGYRSLLSWLRTFGTLLLVGVEGTGAYGAGLARFLHGQGVAMVEVDRPDRKARRWQGSPTRSTPRRPPGPRWPRSVPGHRNSVMVGSRRCARCGARGVAQSPSAPTPSGG